MWKRLVDVAVMKPSGETMILVNHNDYPNTFACVGEFNRYSMSTQTDTMTVSIYNLPASTRGLIALGGYSNIVVNFGYESDIKTLPTLFKGQIRRIINSKDDAITQVTKFFVYDTGEFCQYGFFEGSYGVDVNYYDIFNDILTKGSNPPDSYYLSEALKNIKTLNSFTVYGSSDTELQDTASSLGFLYKRDDNGVRVLSPDEIFNSQKIIDYTQWNARTKRYESASGLIGIPTLTDTGLDFSCLINSSLRTLDLVHIDNSVISISSSGFEPSYDAGATLDANGLYIIMSIKGTFSNTDSDCKMSITALARDGYKQYIQGKQQ